MWLGRLVLTSVLFLSLLAVSLLSSALGTDWWARSAAVLNGTVDDSSVSPNSFVHFGLFHGQRLIDTGALGIRKSCISGERIELILSIFFIWFISVIDEVYRGSLPLPLALWVPLVFFLSVSILVGCATTVLSLINCFLTPINPAFGAKWLHMWAIGGG